MLRDSYHRPLDNPTPRGAIVSAKPAMRVEDAILEITTRELSVGDVIIRPGLIPLIVVDVRFPATGWCVLDFESVPGPGSVTLADPTRLTVRRYVEKAAH